MRVVHRFLAFFTFALASATILENGQVRENAYPGQVSTIALDDSWRTYPPNAPEISYKGRWDSKHVSCMPPHIILPRNYLFWLHANKRQGGRMSHLYFSSNALADHMG
jgi:hypothetical protein